MAVAAALLPSPRKRPRPPTEFEEDEVDKPATGGTRDGERQTPKPTSHNTAMPLFQNNKASNAKPEPLNPKP
jgi:hypothetical protein